ncbi:MAG TPA: malectin domain-containing carbohydrate-binding protein, partial [Chthonomonadaceae bacterium]|nr:malectin domain-containing carbohydrate-binding protein [Chthonomonadaceae bacterium]
NKAVIVAANTKADSSGNITLSFSTSGNQFYYCNGIEILTGSLALTGAPTGFTAKGGNKEVTLAWHAVSGASGYNLLRSTSSSGPFVRINPQTITGTSYKDTGLDDLDQTALTNGQTYYYEVLAVNGVGEGPATTSSVWAIPKGAIDFQINSGGPAVNTFIADNYFNGGDTVSPGRSVDTTGAINPAPSAVYQSCRLNDQGATPFTYTFSTLKAGGAYTVRFHFAYLLGADLSPDPGRNLFSFSVNGATVRSNYDVDAAAGLNTNMQYGNKAVIVAANTKADSSGNITLSFSTSGNQFYYCNGIEILTGSLALTSAPTGLTVTGGSSGPTISWNAVTGAIAYNVLGAAGRNSPFVRINPKKITGTSYLDKSSGSSFYEVLAVNKYGEGPVSLNEFELSVAPPILSVTHGSSIAATLTASDASGQAEGPITLNISAPAGITAWCFPSNVVSLVYPVTNPTVNALSDPANAVLNILVGSNVSPGTYNITITGTSGSFSTSVIVPITVH